jgi:hypothetical protein
MKFLQGTSYLRAVLIASAATFILTLSGLTFLLINAPPYGPIGEAAATVFVASIAVSVLIFSIFAGLEVLWRIVRYLLDIAANVKTDGSMANRILVVVPVFAIFFPRRLSDKGLAVRNNLVRDLLIIIAAEVVGMAVAIVFKSYWSTETGPFRP